MKKKKLKKLLLKEQQKNINLENTRQVHFKRLEDQATTIAFNEENYLSLITKQREEAKFQELKLENLVLSEEEDYKAIIEKQKQEIEDLNKLMSIYEMNAYHHYEEQKKREQ